MSKRIEKIELNNIWANAKGSEYMTLRIYYNLNCNNNGNSYINIEVYNDKIELDGSFWSCSDIQYYKEVGKLIEEIENLNLQILYNRINEIKTEYEEKQNNITIDMEKINDDIINNCLNELIDLKNKYKRSRKEERKIELSKQITIKQNEYDKLKDINNKYGDTYYNVYEALEDEKNNKINELLCSAL